MRRTDSRADKLAGREVWTCVSVKQLRREGLGRLESADINRDGWVDAVDVQMFLQGRRGSGAPRDSVGKAW